MLSAWDAPSIMNNGAFDLAPAPPRIGRTPDPGAPAWVTEPWMKLIERQYWTEHTLPLWNPYTAYGTPLAAAMQPQPYFPLTILTSLHVSPWTYNLFIVGRLLVAGMLMFFFARFFVQRAALDGRRGHVHADRLLHHLPQHAARQRRGPGAGPAFRLRALLAAKLLERVAVAAGMIFSQHRRRNAGIDVPGDRVRVRLLRVPAARLPPNFASQSSSAARSESSSPRSCSALRSRRSCCCRSSSSCSIAHDVHQPVNVGGAEAGLVADSNVTAMIFYLLPLIFGPVNNSIFSNFFGWTGLKSYWGIVPSMLAVAAIDRSVHAGPGGRRSETSFLDALLLAVTLRAHAAQALRQPDRSTGSVTLPISEMVLYYKYQEPLIAVCVASWPAWVLLLPDRAPHRSERPVVACCCRSRSPCLAWRASIGAAARSAPEIRVLLLSLDRWPAWRASSPRPRLMLWYAQERSAAHSAMAGAGSVRALVPRAWRSTMWRRPSTCTAPIRR